MSTSTLTREELQKIRDKLGRVASSLVTTVARLYLSSPSSQGWRYSGVWGACVLVIDRSDPAKPKKIQIYDLENYQLKFQEELCENMVYEALTPQFHCFELERAIAGLCFCNESEATNFHSRVTAMIPKGSSSSYISSSSVGKNTDHKRNKGLLSRFKTFVGTGKGDDAALEVGLPTNVVHVRHIGYDPDEGFQTRDVPEQWKSFFRQAGIKKKDLQQADTAKWIMNTMHEQFNAFVPAAPAPPPSPGVSSGGPPPPPPPGLDLSFATPQAPVISNTSNAPPPPAPRSMNATQDHLAGIRQGVQLKKVDKKEALPDITQLSEQQACGLAASLSSAIAMRRQCVAVEDEVDDDDDWSD